MRPPVEEAEAGIRAGMAEAVADEVATRAEALDGAEVGSERAAAGEGGATAVHEGCNELDWVSSAKAKLRLGLGLGLGPTLTRQCTAPSHGTGGICCW